MNAAARWVLLIAFALATASHAAPPTVTIRRIAVSGDHAPGTPPDVTFFGALEVDAGTVPLIDEDGRVGFAASLAPGVIPNEMGIWIERDGALTLVVRNGDQVPGLAPGVTFAIGGFFSNQPNVANGRTAFSSILANVPNSTEGVAVGLFKETAGGLALVHLGLTQAPGLASGILLGLFPDPPFFNDAGAVSIFAFLSGSDVTRDNDESFWSDRTGALRLIVREGDAAPGTTAVFGAGNSRFTSTGFTGGTFNAQSRLMLHGNLAGEGIDDFNNEGIWVEGPEGLTLLAREGEQAPGLAPGVKFGRTGFFTFGESVPIVLGAGGAALFQARVGGDDVNATGATTLWTNRNGVLEVVALGRDSGAIPEGDPAPGFPPGTSFTSFANARINAANRIAFVGAVEGNGVSGDLFDFGVWSDRSGPLALVVRDGMPVPDLHPGVVFGNPSKLSNTYALLRLTDAGQVLFATEVSGAIPPRTRGLFLSEPDGQIHTVLRTNDVVDLAGDGSDVRSVVDFLGGDMSRAGEFALKLLFADGTIAIVTARVTTSSTTTTSTTAPPSTTTTTLPTQRSTCTSKKLSVAGKSALAATKCHAKAVSKGIALDLECFPKADAKFIEGWGKAEAVGDCLAPTGDAKAVAAKVSAFLDDVVTDLVNAPGPSTCTSKKLTLAGKQASSRLTCHMKAAAKGVAVDPACLQKATDKFTIGWARAEKSADCQAGTGDLSTIEGKVDALVDDVASELLP
jgi:hypothetical protein